MSPIKQVLLKWLAAAGSGVLATGIAFLTDVVGVVSLDMSATEGLVLAGLVTGSTKFLGSAVSKIKAK